MTSKDYKALAANSIEEIRREQERLAKQAADALQERGWTSDESVMIVRMRSQWRKSAYNYELPSNDDTALQFEVMTSGVVESPTDTVSAAFALAGLDPRNPNHWYELLSLFTDLHLKRKPKTKKRTKPFFDQLKKDAEKFADENPEKTRSEVIDELQVKKHKSLATSTLAGLLSKAKAKGFAKSYRRRLRSG